MPVVNVQAGENAPRAARVPLRRRLLAWAQRGWRPAGTVIAIGLALLITWHVVNGKDGLSAWQQKRAQDRELQRQIHSLQQENSQLRGQIQRLQSDPDAIEHEAREKLHYAKPGEVIYALPAPPAAPAQTADTGK
jgi:cell division protein FtsB